MEHINKNRSFSACIREGYKLFRENMRNILISTWKQLTLTGVFFASLMMALIYTDYIWLQGFLAVLSLESLVLFKARVFDMIDYRPYLWNILRMELVCVLAVAVLAIFCLAAKVSSITPAFPFLIATVTLVLLFIVALPLLNVGLDLMMEEKTHPWKAYKTGFRRWGFLFLTVLLSAMICGVVFGIVTTPLAIAVFSATSNQAGIAAGDPSGLPSYFPTLLFLTAFLTAFATLYIQTWQTFAMAFVHGSISYKHENS